MRIRNLFAVFFLMGFQAMAQQLAPVTGDYLEVRSNHVFTCACFQSGELVTGGREAVLAWRIRTGEFSGVSLKGFKAVAVIVGPGNLSLGQTPRKTALYLDGISSESQEKASLALLREQYSKVLGDIVAVHRAPIEFQESGDTTTVDIPQIVTLVVRKSRLPEDAHPGSVLWYDPFILVTRSELSTVLHDEYWGNDLAHRWRRFDAGISGYRGEFALPSRKI